MSWVTPSASVIAATITAGVVGTLGLLLGVATLGSGSLPPPWSALPLAVFAGEVLSVLFSFFPPSTFVAEALVGLCWALLGYALFSGKGCLSEDLGARAAPRGGRRVFFRRAATALGLAALLALGVLAARGVTNALGCGPADREAFAQFPQYGGHQPELRSDLEGGTCLARFPTDAPKAEVLAYYEGKLREHGWEVRRGEAAVTGSKGGSDYQVRYEDYRVPGGHPVTVLIFA